MPEPSLSHRLREDAERISAGLPPLLAAAERLASTAHLGAHGRRKAGMGETFWQFRRYRAEDAAAAVDWRQSAKSQYLFVREREWEAAEAVWFWRDGSPGMRFSSSKNFETKIDRASLLALALASLLVRGGERIALLGEGRAPSSGRAALTRIGYALTDGGHEPLPPSAAMTQHPQFVWLSDFLSPLAEIEAAMRKLSREGVRGHLVHIVDPAEEDFPFAGRTRFEMGRENETLGRAETVAPAYRARFKTHNEAVGALARKLGWSMLTHRTDQRPELALVALYANIAGPRATGLSR